MMKSYKERLATFTSWPHVSPPAADLARAGFAYAPSEHCPDKVRCLECNQHITNWQPGENPLLEHIRVAPHCKLAFEITAANMKETSSVLRSLIEKGTHPVAQPATGIKPQPTTEASSLKALFEKCQQDSSKQHEQQSVWQLLQRLKSKQDQQEITGLPQTTTQDSKQAQIDEPALKTAQTTSLPAATTPTPLKPSMTPNTLNAVPTTSAAAAEISSSCRPSTPVPAASTPKGHHMSAQSWDTKAGKVLAKADLPRESPEKAVADVEDWVELDLDKEENDDWVQV